MIISRSVMREDEGEGGSRREPTRKIQRVHKNERDGRNILDQLGEEHAPRLDLPYGLLHSPTHCKLPWCLFIEIDIFSQLRAIMLPTSRRKRYVTTFFYKIRRLTSSSTVNSSTFYLFSRKVTTPDDDKYQPRSFHQ